MNDQKPNDQTGSALAAAPGSAVCTCPEPQSFGHEPGCPVIEQNAKELSSFGAFCEAGKIRLRIPKFDEMTGERTATEHTLCIHTAARLLAELSKAIRIAYESNVPMSEPPTKTL